MAHTGLGMDAQLPASIGAPERDAPWCWTRATQVALLLGQTMGPLYCPTRKEQMVAGLAGVRALYDERFHGMLRPVAWVWKHPTYWHVPVHVTTFPLTSRQSLMLPAVPPTAAMVLRNNTHGVADAMLRALEAAKSMPVAKKQIPVRTGRWRDLVQRAVEQARIRARCALVARAAGLRQRVLLHRERVMRGALRALVQARALGLLERQRRRERLRGAFRALRVARAEALVAHKRRRARCAQALGALRARLAARRLRRALGRYVVRRRARTALGFLVRTVAYDAPLGPPRTLLDARRFAQAVQRAVRRRADAIRAAVARRVAGLGPRAADALAHKLGLAACRVATTCGPRDTLRGIVADLLGDLARPRPDGPEASEGLLRAHACAVLRARRDRWWDSPALRVRLDDKVLVPFARRAVRAARARGCSVAEVLECWPHEDLVRAARTLPADDAWRRTRAQLAPHVVSIRPALARPMPAPRDEAAMLTLMANCVDPAILGVFAEDDAKGDVHWVGLAVARYEVGLVASLLWTHVVLYSCVRMIALQVNYVIKRLRPQLLDDATLFVMLQRAPYGCRARSSIGARFASLPQERRSAAIAWHCYVGTLTTIVGHYHHVWTALATNNLVELRSVLATVTQENLIGDDDVRLATSYEHLLGLHRFADHVFRADDEEPPTLVVKTMLAAQRQLGAAAHAAHYELTAACVDALDLVDPAHAHLMRGPAVAFAERWARTAAASLTEEHPSVRRALLASRASAKDMDIAMRSFPPSGLRLGERVCCEGRTRFALGSLPDDETVGHVLGDPTDEAFVPYARDPAVGAAVDKVCVPATSEREQQRKRVGLDASRLVLHSASLVPLDELASGLFEAPMVRLGTLMDPAAHPLELLGGSRVREATVSRDMIRAQLRESAARIADMRNCDAMLTLPVFEERGSGNEG